VFESFDIWDFHLEDLGDVAVDGRLPARDETSHLAEGVRVSDERRGGIFHVYVLHPPPDGGERIVLGRRFDADEPQLATSRAGVVSYRLTAGIRPESSGCSMLFRIAGPWRGECAGWTAVGASPDEALRPVGGTSGLLELLSSVPDAGTPSLQPGPKGKRIAFTSAAITGPVSFWCLSRLMPLQTRDRSGGGLLPTSA
jgi:hypothetical protein